MTDKVTDINKARKSAGAEPHITGRCRCKVCQYEWVVTAPAGVVTFICQICASDAHLTGEVMTEGPQGTCACGYQLFRIDQDGPYCCRCGAHVADNFPG